MASTSKIVLYTFDHSPWVKGTILALSELGYPFESVQIKEVISVEGEEYCPEFFGLNPLATVPTLVFDDEVVVDSVPVSQWLVKHAPNPLSRKRGTAKAARLIESIHDPTIDINVAFLAARDHEELKQRATGLAGLYVATRQSPLEKYAARAPPELREVYQQRIQLNLYLSSLYSPYPAEATTAPWFDMSNRIWHGINMFILHTLPTWIPSNAPFISGKGRPGEEDFHVAAWLAQVVVLCGGIVDPTYSRVSSAIYALEKELGKGRIPGEVVRYWQSWVQRPSWQLAFGGAS